MKKIYSKMLFALSICLFAVAGSLMAQAPDNFTTVDATFNGGSFDGEISWAIVDDAGTELLCVDNASGTAGTVYSFVTANDVDFTVHMFDSFGDTWNGATLDLVANETAENYTNACAPNFNVIALGVQPASATTGFGGCGMAPYTSNAPQSFSTICVPCAIMCPADVVVDNDPGVCGATVVVDSAMTAGCSAMIIGDCVDYEGSIDLIYAGSGAGDGLMETVLEITGVPTTLDVLITEVDIEICVSGDFGNQEDELTALTD